MIIKHSEFVVMKIEPFLQDYSSVVAPIVGDANLKDPEAHAKRFG
jgi:hypothetical protein